MMNYYKGADFALPLAWHLHMIFGTILFIGIVFLFIWAIKTFDKKQLKRWTIWLLVIGIIGALATCPWGTRGWNQMMDWDGKDGKSSETASDDDQDSMLEEMEENMGFDEEEADETASEEAAPSEEEDAEATIDLETETSLVQ